MNSTRISQALLKVTESFSASPTHSWLCGVVVKTPDWESLGFSSNTGFFLFLSSLISLILNTKSEKHKSLEQANISIGMCQHSFCPKGKGSLYDVTSY